MKTKEFLKALDDHKIAEAITEAEKNTSGELRVYVTEREVSEVVPEAEKQFVKLGMTKTESRNGVLIFFAPCSQKFAVIGDLAVNERCGAQFWQHITEEMTPLLKLGKFTDAILLAVKEIGEVLAKEFPWTRGDKDELPNKVARDEPQHE
jgi:uncharacterized membrane protein